MSFWRECENGRKKEEKKRTTKTTKCLFWSDERITQRSSSEIRLFASTCTYFVEERHVEDHVCI